HLLRHGSALVVTIAVAVGILLPCFFVIYSGSYRLLALLSELEIPKDGALIGTMLAAAGLRKWMKQISRFVPIDRNWLREQALAVIANVVENLSKLIASFFAGMPGLLLGFAVVLISVYFFITDGGKFLKFLARLSPMKPERSVELYETFE